MKKELKLRVSYADTDQMGMVYYANYLVYFERGRTEWLREHGLTYRGLEEKGVLLPVVECTCSYQGSARYDDVITVTSWVSDTGPASIEFSYEIRNEHGKLLTTGTTKHPFVNRSFKPVRIPPDIRRLVEKKHG